MAEYAVVTPLEQYHPGLPMSGAGVEIWTESAAAIRRCRRVPGLLDIAVSAHDKSGVAGGVVYCLSARISPLYATQADAIANELQLAAGLGADLSLALEADELAPAPGGAVVLTLALTNSGPNDAEGAEVTLTLPTGLDYVEDNGDEVRGTFDDTTGVWTAPVSIPRDTTLHLHVTCAVAELAEVGSELLVSAAVTDVDQVDPDPDDIIATVTLVVTAAEE